MFSVDNIMSRFVDYFDKRPDSNLSKLISIFSEELMNFKETNDRILEWRSIDQAQGEALNLIGENINQARGAANDEVYRILLKSKIARSLSDGSINMIIQVLSIALSTEPSEIKIVEKWTDSSTPEPAAISVIELPIAALNAAGLDPVQFGRIVQRTVAAGVKVDAINLEGTFEFGPTAIVTDNSKGFGDIEQTIGGFLGAVYSPSTNQDLPI